MAKNDFGNFIGGLLSSIQQTYVSERDKNREQERLSKEEARQEAVLSLQRLQNKQRVNEFNKSFEFQQNQTNVENVRNADKIRFDKLVAQKELYKQYAPIESMPKSTDGFVFNQAVPGTIDDEFTKQSGSDVLANDKQYYDTNAYQNAYSMYLDKLRTDAYANQVGGNSNKGRIAVVHKPSGTIKLLKEDDYYKKIDQGYYPMDTWTPMTIEQASVLGMSQAGYDKSGKVLNPTSTPGQVASVFSDALGNSNALWFNKMIGNETGQTLSESDIFNRLKPSGLESYRDLGISDDIRNPELIQDSINRIRKTNNAKWTTQKLANAQGIQGFLSNVFSPLQEVIASSHNWKDTPTGKAQRDVIEVEVGKLEAPLKTIYSAIDAGLIDPSVKSDVYNALQFARGYAKKQAVQLELQRRNALNQGMVKQEIKSLTDK